MQLYGDIFALNVMFQIGTGKHLSLTQQCHMELHLILLEQNSLPIQNTSNGATDTLWHLNSNNADVRAKLKMCCILESTCALRFKKKKKGFTGFWQQNLQICKKKIYVITYKSAFIVEQLQD